MTEAILVGYDTAVSDRAPVKFAVAAARCTRAPLIVACAYETEGARDRLGAGQTQGDLIAGVPHAFDKVEEDLEAAGVRISYCGPLDSANTAHVLHQMARIERTGLLVVGRARQRPVLAGSFVERVIHGAPCAVAVVPHGWDPSPRHHAIGVAYVESSNGHDALRGAHSIARRARATLRVVTAVELDRGTEALVSAQPPGSLGSSIAGSARSRSRRNALRLPRSATRSR